jgi:hypothetical protein
MSSTVRNASLVLVARTVLSNHEMGNSSQLLVPSTSLQPWGNACCYKMTSSPCASLSWKCRSLRVNSVTRSVRAQEILHACMPNLVSLPATHTMHVLASEVIFAKEIGASHAFLSSRWHVLSCLPPGQPCQARYSQAGTRQNEETLLRTCLQALHKQCLRKLNRKRGRDRE